MTGEQLELLEALALDYDVARDEEQRAAKQKEEKRKAILALLKEAHEHLAVTAMYTCEVVPVLRETIPARLAKQLLPPATYAQLLQSTTSITLRVTPHKGV